MKVSFLSLLLIFWGFQCLAQQADKTLAKVRYSFSHIDDTTHRYQPRTENMILLIGKNASKYVSFDAIEQQANMDKMIREQMANNQGNNLSFNMGKIKNVNRNEDFYFANENKFIELRRLINYYLIEEPTYTIDWKIKNDTASFEGISCQKATARFRGRNWIAWFATELPFQSGPWKLHGLPGLIIDAYDDKGEVKFSFAGLETVEDDVAKVEVENLPPGLEGFGKMSANQNEIKLPANAIKTTVKEFENLREAMKKDPSGFLSTQLPTGVKMTRTEIKSPTAPASTKSKTMNNPIELADK